jgi:hypothetical protein
MDLGKIKYMFRVCKLDMDTRKLLLLAALALFAGAIAGAVTQSVPAWVGTTFLAFVLLMAIYPWISRRLSGKDPALEAEAKTVASELSRERTALAYNPDIEPPAQGVAMTEQGTVDTYSRSFGISEEKARSLYRSGYKRWGDLQEAILEDLIMVQGINPTVAKRIIETVRGKQQ